MPNRADGLNAASNGEAQLVEIKSKFDAEFRRFAVDKTQMNEFSEFYKLVCRLHRLEDFETSIAYSDRDGELLPINNDNNLGHALNRAQSANALLRIVVQRKGDNAFHLNLGPKSNLPLIGKLMPPKAPARPRMDIGEPVSFRPVSAIIDVHLVPATHLRVKLMKNGSDRPLGFYIRDGVSLRVTPTGVEKVPGIFISRLVPGGLAQHTGLLSVGDEVLEVNGIDVGDKTLDQVTDMMIANANNLIITVKPANQQLTLAAGRRNSSQRSKPSNQTRISSTPNPQVLGTNGDSHQVIASHRKSNDQAKASGATQSSPSHSAGSGSNQSGHRQANESGSVVIEEDSCSEDSDLEADEVHIHENNDSHGSNSPAKNGDKASVEHHLAARDALNHAHSDEENDRSTSNYQLPSTTASNSKLSKDAVLRI